MDLLRRLMLGTALTLAFGVSAGDASAKTTVRVTVAVYSEQTEAIFNGMAADFEKANPEIDIQIEMVPWDNLQQRLTTDIQAGSAPDLAVIGTRWLVDYVKNDVAEPLDGYITPEFKGRFIQTFLAPAVMDGKTWGLPVAASARAMYYDKALLAKAGVASPPATWAELEAAARKVRALGPDTYGFGLQGKEIETDAYWYYALWSHGGALIDNGKSSIASPAAIQAATLYKRLVDDGLTQPKPTGYNRQDVEGLLKQGKVGMILSGPWLRSQMKRDAPTIDYGIAPIPTGTMPATYGVTDSLMMFKSSKVKKEAWKFLTDSAFTDKWRTEFTVKEGFLPVFSSVAALPGFTNDPQLKAFTDQLPNARFAPLVVDWEQMADATASALQKIYLGEATPEAALKAAQTRIDGLLR